jgi:hypothetical protein
VAAGETVAGDSGGTSVTGMSFLTFLSMIFPPTRRTGHGNFGF